MLVGMLQYQDGKFCTFRNPGPARAGLLFFLSEAGQPSQSRLPSSAWWREGGTFRKCSHIMTVKAYVKRIHDILNDGVGSSVHQGNACLSEEPCAGGGAGEDDEG